MQLTPRYFLLQFAHSLQQSMFALEPDLGPVPSQLELLAAIMSMAPLERLLSARRAVTGRPAKDRAALATAFIAKAILNLGTTRDLIARLKVDEPLRRLCGWSSASKLPHEAKFSRAFTEFAATELPQQLHAAVIELTLKDQLMGHVAHDATAIPLRERYPDSAKATKQAKLKKKGKKSRKGKHARAKAAERGTRIQRQRHQTLEKMLDELPRNCDCGQAGRIRRAIEKNTAALNAMQAQRKSAYAKAEAEAILLTQLAHAKGQTVDAAKDFPSPELCGGFVYSLPEIARLISRAVRVAEANAHLLSAS
jgi:hypothetical protein